MVGGHLQLVAYDVLTAPRRVLGIRHYCLA